MSSSVSAAEACAESGAETTPGHAGALWWLCDTSHAESLVRGPRFTRKGNAKHGWRGHGERARLCVVSCRSVGPQSNRVPMPDVMTHHDVRALRLLDECLAANHFSAEMVSEICRELRLAERAAQSLTASRA
jgi:hypothetical protein